MKCQNLDHSFVEAGQVTWCFTPRQPLRLYQGEWLSRDSGKNMLVVRCLFGWLLFVIVVAVWFGLFVIV